MQIPFSALLDEESSAHYSSFILENIERYGNERGKSSSQKEKTTGENREIGKKFFSSVRVKIFTLPNEIFHSPM